MALLPVRHPQKDFFILDIADAVPKDDTASMEHPLFSLATKPDMRHLSYGNSKDNTFLEIIPSAAGLPTIFDKDILIFCISQLMHLKNQGQPIGKRLRFSARELSIATNRPIGGNHYKRLEQAFIRLRGATFKTNIKSGAHIETRIFGMIDEGGFVMRAKDWKLDYCEVVLSDWLMAAIESANVVTISEEYFRLRRPLERRLYEIARKHCGAKERWQIRLENLQAKTGSNAPLYRFRFNLREIIEEDHTPDYRFELDDSDMVTIRKRNPKREFRAGIVLPASVEDQARKIAIAKGRDYHAAREEWLAYASAQTAKGNPPKNAGGAFVSWLKKKPALR